MRLPKLAWWKWLLIAYLGLTVIGNIPLMLELLQIGQGSSIVAAVEPQLIRHLQQLPGDSPLIKAFGRFQSLSGRGSHRSGIAIVPRIIAERTLQFEKGQVRTTLEISATVEPQDTCDFSIRSSPESLKNPVSRDNRLFEEYIAIDPADGRPFPNPFRKEITLEIWAYKPFKP